MKHEIMPGYWLLVHKFYWRETKWEELLLRRYLMLTG